MCLSTWDMLHAKRVMVGDVVLGRDSTGRKLGTQQQPKAQQSLTHTTDDIGA